MVENSVKHKPPLLSGLLASAGILVLALVLNRALLWVYGFPQGLVQLLVTLACLALLVILVLALLRLAPNARHWTSFDGWARRDIIIFWLVGGCILSAYMEASKRIERPDLSFVVTLEDVIYVLVTGLIMGTIIGAFIAFVAGRGRN